MATSIRFTRSIGGLNHAKCRPSVACLRGANRSVAIRRGARLVARADLDGVMDEASKARMREMERRFRMADADGNGYIDREELRNLLESMESGEVYMLSQHWLPEGELDRAMETYDTNKDGVISFEEFKQIQSRHGLVPLPWLLTADKDYRTKQLLPFPLQQPGNLVPGIMPISTCRTTNLTRLFCTTQVYDGILLEGTLAEYESAFKAIDKSGNGTIGATELGQLFAQLGSPVSPEKLVDLMQMYDKDDSGQIEFNEFLVMFRNNLLDLRAMSSYMTNEELDGVQMGSGTGAVVEAVEGDMTIIFSEQELDEIITANPNKLVVVFGALTWCRPCKAMQRPVQKLAEHYKDHIVFVKLFGNANKQTKKMFKERFQVRSTPCFITLRQGQPVYTQTGSNKEKLETGLRSLLSNPPVGMVYPSDPVAVRAL